MAKFGHLDVGAIYGDIWQYMAIYGDIWQYVAIYGNMLPYVAIYGTDISAHQNIGYALRH